MNEVFMSIQSQTLTLCVCVLVLKTICYPVCLNSREISVSARTKLLDLLWSWFQAIVGTWLALRAAGGCPEGAERTTAEILEGADSVSGSGEPLRR